MCLTAVFHVMQAIDINKFSTMEELMSLGGDRLKYTLQSMGLKCGGTVKERAQRLLSTKGKSIDDFDKTIFAKKR
jgi:splicing factor 3A subunit 3